jgi:hypothetical protein
MGRTKRAICDVYEELKERAKETGLNIREKKKINCTKWKKKNSS